MNAQIVNKLVYKKILMEVSKVLEDNIKTYKFFYNGFLCYSCNTLDEKSALESFSYWAELHSLNLEKIKK